MQPALVHEILNRPWLVEPRDVASFVLKRYMS